MDGDQAGAELRGKLLAHEMVLIGLCSGLRSLGPPYDELVRQVFSQVEGVADSLLTCPGSISRPELESFYSALERMREF